MNISDFGEIIEDEFTGTFHGKTNRIEILGWSGRKVTKKRYIVKCHICCQDSELFGEGIFETTKSQLITRGLNPCGCSYSPKWTEDQNKIRCQRKASGLGFSFIGWAGEYIGDKTKLLLCCDCHGIWNTGVLNHLMNGRGCPGCKGSTTADYNRKAKTKPYDYFVQSFMDTGAFADGTTFTKIERTDKNGYKTYWLMSCPDCGESGEILGSDLQKGRRPCACTPQRQKQAYINGIFYRGSLIALKFGIAVRYEDRLVSQNRNSVYDLKSLCVYEFGSVEDCRKAERLCKQTLECGILDKSVMSDGYTETTHVHNRLDIENIFKICGGCILKEYNYDISP